MKPYILLTLLFTIIHTQSDRDIKTLFDSWKIQYSKSYSDPIEEEYRFSIFSNSYSYIVSFNSAGNTAHLALNGFADLTSEEFASFYTGSSLLENLNEINTGCNTPSNAPTNSWNWATNASIVTPVKDQGQCGSCWAFAAVATTESLYALNGNPLTSFSEQQIVDCDTQCDGCNGGYPQYAMTYIANNGLETETDYPYMAKTDKCVYNSSQAIQTGVQGSCAVQTKSTSALKNAAYQQPTTVLIQASQPVFQFYDGGIISTGCGTVLDHAVTVTGYTDLYFIVKNSWGSTWGINGYVYISSYNGANDGVGVCGILSQPFFPEGLNL